MEIIRYFVIRNKLFSCEISPSRSDVLSGYLNSHSEAYDVMRQDIQAVSGTVFTMSDMPNFNLGDEKKTECLRKGKYSLEIQNQKYAKFCTPEKKSWSWYVERKIIRLSSEELHAAYSNLQDQYLREDAESFFDEKYNGGIELAKALCTSPESFKDPNSPHYLLEKAVTMFKSLQSIYIPERETWNQAFSYVLIMQDRLKKL